MCDIGQNQRFSADSAHFNNFRCCAFRTKNMDSSRKAIISRVIAMCAASGTKQDPITQRQRNYFYVRPLRRKRGYCTVCFR